MCSRPRYLRILYVILVWKDYEQHNNKHIRKLKFNKWIKRSYNKQVIDSVDLEEIGTKGISFLVSYSPLSPVSKSSHFATAIKAQRKGLIQQTPVWTFKTYTLYLQYPQFSSEHLCLNAASCATQWLVLQTLRRLSRLPLTDAFTLFHSTCNRLSVDHSPYLIW